jgi:hypothetical protein
MLPLYLGFARVIPFFSIDFLPTKKKKKKKIVMIKRGGVIVQIMFYMVGRVFT